MTTRRYDAYAVDVDPPENGMPVGPLVGGTDAMRTSDGASSYATVGHTGQPTADPTTHTFRFGDVGPILPDDVVKIEADWRTNGDPAYGALFNVAGSFVGAGGTAAVATFSIPNGSAITFGTLQQFTVSPSIVTTYPVFFGPDGLWHVTSSTLAFAPPEGSIGSVADITRLTLIVETTGAVYPHRLMQRGDGLGMGSARVYARDTRQSSGRVFGSY